VPFGLALVKKEHDRNLADRGGRRESGYVRGASLRERKRGKKGRKMRDP